MSTTHNQYPNLSTTSSKISCWLKGYCLSKRIFIVLQNLSQVYCLLTVFNTSTSSLVSEMVNKAPEFFYIRSTPSSASPLDRLQRSSCSRTNLKSHLFFSRHSALFLFPSHSSAFKQFSITSSALLLFSSRSSALSLFSSRFTTSRQSFSPSLASYKS